MPDKIGEGVRERKEIRGGRAGKEEYREACRKGRRSGGERERKEIRRSVGEDVRERKEIGEGTDGAGCVWQFCNLPHGCQIHFSIKKRMAQKSIFIHQTLYMCITSSITSTNMI